MGWKTLESQREYAKKWRDKNKEHKLAYDRKWRKEHSGSIQLSSKKSRIKNREKRTEYNRMWVENNKDASLKYGREWRMKNKNKCSESCWKSSLKRNFGMSHLDYNKKLSEQGGVCAVCGGINKGGRKLAVDHNHKNNLVRGLLCSRCNLVIGSIYEDITILHKMIKYLVAHDWEILKEDSVNMEEQNGVHCIN
jgi:hypothetical protein